MFYAVYRLTLDDGSGLPLLEELELIDPLGFNPDVMAINDHGDVIGSVAQTGFLWSTDGDGDGFLDAVALPFGVRFSGGAAITNRAADGSVQITGDMTDVFVTWRWTGDISGNGVLEDLGGGTGGNGSCLDINNLGDVVGEDGSSTAFSLHGCEWHRRLRPASGESEEGRTL